MTETANNPPIRFANPAGHSSDNLIVTDHDSPSGTAPCGYAACPDHLATPMSEGEKAHHFDAMANAMVDPFLLFEAIRDDDGNTVDFIVANANKLACAKAGVEPEDVLGQSFLTLRPEHRDSEPMKFYVTAMNTGQPIIMRNYLYPVPMFGETGRRYDVSAVPSGEQYLALVLRDVTEGYDEAAALSESEELYRAIADDIADAIIRMDNSFHVYWVSPSFEELTGLKLADIKGKDGAIIASDEDYPKVAGMQEVLRGNGRIEGGSFRIRQADGGSRWVSVVAAHPFFRSDGYRDGCVAIIRDLQPEIDAQADLVHRDNHDQMTGLANKELTLDRMQDFMDARRDGQCALLTIGIDQLRRVNEALTYAGGDEVMKVVASRLLTVCHDPEDVGRVTGDEFTIILPGTAGDAEATAAAERICQIMRDPIELSNGRALTITVSVGIAMAVPGVTPHELLTQSTLAMRQAKELGRDRWTFADEDMILAASKRLDIEDAIRAGLDNGEFVPWFQPVVRLRDRTVTGYEALARWVKPDGTVMPPADFIPVAESGKLIVDIDKTMIEQSIKALRTLPTQHMAANVSVATLAAPGFVTWLEEIIRENVDLAPRLRLEVTETALLQIGDDTLEQMRRIAATGARWYADDFGVGYSSISYLRDLPIAGLKLDMSFTRGVNSGESQSIRLAQGLAGLAHGLGIDTVAEGVETEMTAVLLGAQGWEEAQGWHFGKPAPFDS